MVEAAASAVAIEAYRDGRTIFSYISRKFDYADDFKRNYTRLMEAASRLSARKEDVENEIDQNRTKQATKECDDWRQRVAEAQDKCKELEQKYLKETRRRSGLHRLWRRANLSKKMLMKVEELRGLLQDGKLENGVMVDRGPDRVRTIQAPTTIDKPSLHGIVEEIIGFLADQGVDRIGLWGMVGIGKTTILQNLNNHSKVAQMFNIVLWVTVSKAASLEKVQDAIAQRLNLRFEEGTNPSEVARRISMELDGMRYLLILDEIWDSFDLVSVGFPNRNNSKVVLASRFRHVCTDMNVDELVNVKRASETDAWKIFEEKVGRNMQLPGVRPVAQQVIKECAGLPLLLDRVARTFRNKNDVRLWREGLRSLRRWTSISNRAMDEVLQFLRYCYDDLDDNGKKSCFLYGAMFPEDCDILVDYLLECWICEGYIDNVEGFRDARDKGHTIMHELVSASLLELSEKKKHIRMNKVIRDMALHISSQSVGRKYLIRTREGLKEAPNEIEWESSIGISLMDNALCTLPDTPNCEHLSSLLLQKNRELLAIPEEFFTSMQSLRVLDLHRTGIASLPSSLSCSTTLNALYLNSCTNLTQLPTCMEKLQQLKVLDIRGTNILPFPALIGGLTRLKCLRMSLSNFDTRDVEANHDAIAKLSLLEELVIDVDSINRCNDRAFQVVSDHVATLPLLTSLTFFFPDVDRLNRFINASPSWTKSHFTFEFYVGYPEFTTYSILDYFDYEIRRCLKYGKGNGAHTAFIEVLKETEVVELVGHVNFLSLSDFGMENMNNLRGCLLKDCNDIECIINGDSIGTSCALESLEILHISNSPNLQSIWKGSVAAGSFAHLKSLTLQNCPKLTNLFSSGLIEQMSGIQILTIKDCHAIKEIIAESENPSLDPNALSSLKILVLHALPTLSSITSTALNWPSLEKVEVLSCSSLLKLPFTQNNAVNLKSIEGQQTWWDLLEWQESATKVRLVQLFTLS